MGRRMQPVATAALLATALTATLVVGPTIARADVIQSYQYTSDAGITNGAGAHSITLQGNAGPSQMTATAASPGVFTLGTFSVGPLLPGETDRYRNTPFTVDLKVTPAGDPAAAATPYDYQISGVLNGSIRSNGTSTLFPSITSITGSGAATAPFPVEDLKINLPMIAAPFGLAGSTTTLTASVAVDGDGNPLPAPAPEPTSVAIFAAALAGLAWKRRLAARKASS